MLQNPYRPKVEVLGLRMMIKTRKYSLNPLLPWYYKREHNYDFVNQYEFTGWSRFDPDKNREEFFLIHVKTNTGLWTWEWD